MSETVGKTPFEAGGYIEPYASNGINGGNEFGSADVLYADDLNKIVKNQMHLKEKKADLDSPALTGIPTAPTAADAVKTGQIATAQFVHNVIASQLPYATENPRANGTAAIGTSNKVARADHIHPKPSAADVGLGNVTNESKTTMFANPNFTGAVNQNGRPIGEVRIGFGNIAVAGSGYNNVTSGLRFNASITAIFLGNRNWRIIGTGAGSGGFGAAYQGFSPAHIGSILKLGSDFFATAQLERNGKFFRYSRSTGAMHVDMMGYGAVFGRTSDSYNIMPGRVHLSDSSAIGGWADGGSFEKDWVIDFEFILKAAKD